MSYLVKIVAACEPLGVGGELAEARRYLDRVNELHAELGALRGAAERERAQLVASLAEGKKVEPAAVSAGAVRCAGWEYDGPAAKMYVAAVAAAHNRADAAAAAAAPKLFEALQRLAGEVVAESVKLVGGFPSGVVDERTAYRAGQQHFAAWMQLDALLARWAAVHQAAKILRDACWVADFRLAGSAVYDGRSLFLEFERPERLPEGFWALQPALRLASASRAKARPGLYDGDDALARWRATQPRSLEQSGQVVETFSGSGHLVGRS